MLMKTMLDNGTHIFPKDLKKNGDGFLFHFLRMHLVKAHLLI